MCQILRQLFVRLKAKKMHVRHGMKYGQINAGLFFADQDKTPIWSGLCRRFEIIILNAALQRADKTENRVWNTLHIFRHRLLLRCLHKALKIRAVRDHIRIGLHRVQPLSQCVGCCKHMIGFLRKFQFHRINECRIHQSAVG